MIPSPLTSACSPGLARWSVQIAVPVYRWTMLGCLCDVYYDRDHIVIVPGDLKDAAIAGRNRGCDDPGTGWFVELEPFKKVVL